MKIIKTPKKLTLKDGTIIPANTSLQFVRHLEDSTTIGVFALNGVEMKMRYRSVIKNPAMRTLEKWSYDSVCKSVFGCKVEPDGCGKNGEPSWLLALNMI